MLPLTLLVTLMAAQAAQAPPPAVGARTPFSRAEYAGVDACQSCHARESRTFRATAHWRTSQLATRESIVAPFTPGTGHVVTSNPDLHYEMEMKDGAFFETAITTGAAARTRTQRIDMVIGSGKKGQTFLWWRDAELLQLPMSYWSELKAWAPNPGFTDRTADFTRPVPPRCLDCHTTFVELMAGADRYNRSTALLGVGCEKCHGTAAGHAAARRGKSNATVDGDVVNPARLTRDQKVDLCASCHGGQKKGVPFSFRPGDSVIRAPLVSGRSGPPGTIAGANMGIDSHGQQATALMNSRCFQNSQMTCETCHDPHAAAPDVRMLAAKCVTCHKAGSHKRLANETSGLEGRCVDCHMPLQPSNMILARSAAGGQQATLRSHLIAIYPASR